MRSCVKHMRILGSRRSKSEIVQFVVLQESIRSLEKRAETAGDFYSLNNFLAS